MVRSADIRRQQYDGHHLARAVRRHHRFLAQKVHISFDIDGLDPTLCPNTGTPVPGGFQFEEATYLSQPPGRLVEAVARSSVSTWWK
jgi:agmatinase